jgi:hypothetical protein
LITNRRLSNEESINIEFSSVKTWSSSFINHYVYTRLRCFISSNKCRRRIYRDTYLAPRRAFQQSGRGHKLIIRVLFRSVSLQYIYGFISVYSSGARFKHTFLVSFDLLSDYIVEEFRSRITWYTIQWYSGPPFRGPPFRGSTNPGVSYLIRERLSE